MAPTPEWIHQPQPIMAPDLQVSPRNSSAYTSLQVVMLPTSPWDWMPPAHGLSPIWTEASASQVLSRWTLGHANMGIRILNHIKRWPLCRSFTCLVSSRLHVFPFLLNLALVPGHPSIHPPVPSRGTPPVRRSISLHVNELEVERERERPRERDRHRETETSGKETWEHRDTQTCVKRLLSPFSFLFCSASVGRHCICILVHLCPYLSLREHILDCLGAYEATNLTCTRRASELNFLVLPHPISSASLRPRPRHILHSRLRHRVHSAFP
ncbi:hypothetical protein F5Y14DRAFT_347835 [Nemania sp. NC0429]|nr:hypothetical protein F5Y14DRAFT_347835 [Nemania sp. NC0429]